MIRYRRVVFVFLLMAGIVTATIFPAASKNTVHEAVQVEIYENVPEGSLPDYDDLEPTTRYTEPAFGFVRVPTKYSENALPLDRSSPFILRAFLDREIPAGEYRFRLRARGEAWFLKDGKVLAKTDPQKPNRSGDDDVPPPPEIDESGRRPAHYPHQDRVITLRLDGKSHRFTVVAVIGGEGLYPTPGELCLSFGPPGEIEHLLGPNDETPLLVDAQWEAYVANQEDRHERADVAHRREASREVVNLWEARHEEVRKWLKRQPAPEIPEVSAGTPIYNDIDRFIGQRLEEAGIEPMPLTSDLEFLRRLTLDTIGMVPSREEIERYLADPPSVRRQQAVERLLAHPGWADHWVSYWQDVLAENPGILKPDLNNTGPFRWWLHQSLTDNIPFDRLVTELIEMKGSVYKGGPAGFGVATQNDAPMAAKADIIFQSFQAKKLACARCHDAPFHPFKQKQTFSLAAMLEGEPIELPAASTVPLTEGRRKPAVEISLRPGDVIHAEWPFDGKFAESAAAHLPTFTDIPTRHQLAAEIVSPRNERFPRVIVNRVWKRYMGQGLIEPVNDWSQAEPSHPELLQYLAREFMINGYDLKHLARLIFSSHAYQRKPVPEALTSTAPDERLFAGPLHRRMTAEQLVDSLHRSVGKSPRSEKLNLSPAGDRPPRQFLDMGEPERAWEMTALSNERDRPSLALPMAQSVVDVLTAFGWRQSRQSPMTERDDAPREMQTLILANGILGTRIVRLSDDSAMTQLSLQDLPLKELLEETFLRVLTRRPAPDEIVMFEEYLRPFYEDRIVEGAKKRSSELQFDQRVSWANHLSEEANAIRMDQERRLRMGEEPTERLRTEFRERFEDVLWTLVNSPEFVLIP